MSIRGVLRAAAAPAGAMPLWSFSQDPRVANNPNPIYAPGSPQWLAAVASGANPTTPSYTPEQLAVMLPAPVVSPPPAAAVAFPVPAVNVSPISLTQPAAAPAPSAYLYTADEETVQQLMYQLGDTWDNPQSVVTRMYAAGIAPGTVSQANALPYLSVSSAAATTSTSTLSSIPTWGWVALGIGALFMLSAKK